MPFEDVRPIEWHLNQPILANYKNKGRWVKAKIMKIKGDLIWGQGTANIMYTEWGDDRMEYFVTQDRLRPRVAEDIVYFRSAQHLISLIVSPSRKSGRGRCSR